MKGNKSSGNLDSVLRLREVAEKKALEETVRTKAILESRENDLLELQEERKKSLERIENLVSQRNQFIFEGALESLPGLLEYERKLKLDLTALEKAISEKEIEIGRANERMRSVTADFTESRVERRKVENLISRRMERNEVIEQGVSEQEADESACWSASNKAHEVEG